MATEAYRQKRIEFTKGAIERLQAKKAKAEKQIEAAEADLLRYEQLIAWLESMPVEDAEVGEAEPEVGDTAGGA